MSEFDKVAAEWDKNKMHTDRSEAIANKLLPFLENKSLNTALEYGAGTGLLSFLLKDRFEEIILMDSSREMVNTANAKIAETGEKHMKAIFFDLEQDDYTGKFDIIFTQMVLHHVDNVDLIFQKFNQLLTPEGIMAVADLYTEDGSFHGEGFTGHLGFEPEQLKKLLLKNGFGQVTYETVFTIKKETQQGIKEFPIFLIFAQKTSK